MLEKLNEELKLEVEGLKDIDRQIRNLQARKNNKKRKIENIKVEIQHAGAGQLNLFG